MQFKELKAIAKNLKPIYAAPSAEAAPAALDVFEEGAWGPEVPTDRRQLAPQVGAGHSVLRVLAGGPQDHLHEQRDRSLHSQVRKTVRNKGHFPSDDAAVKLICLALRQIEAKWKRPPKEWHAAKSQLAIQFGERFALKD
jgi:putative transposase